MRTPLIALTLALSPLALTCQRAPLAPRAVTATTPPIERATAAPRTSAPKERPKAKAETASERSAALELRRALIDARTRDDLARFRDVERRTAAALVKHPGSRALRHIRVSALLALGRGRDALADARALVRSDEQDPVAAGLLGDALMATGNITGAVVAVEKMMALAPGLPAYARAAQLRLATGDVEGSIMMWGEALLAGHKSEPESLAFCATGAGDTLLYASGDLAGARKAYDTALQAVPGYPAARVGRARIHFAQGRANEALADLDAIDADARTPSSAALHASILASIGQAPKEADFKAQLTKLAEREPNEAAVALAARNLDLALARTLLEQRVEASGAMADTAALAYVLARGDSAERARCAAHARTATSSGTVDARVLALSGLALARVKDADAQAMLARVKPTGLDPALAAEVTTTLATLAGAR